MRRLACAASLLAAYVLAAVSNVAAEGRVGLAGEPESALTRHMLNLPHGKLAYTAEAGRLPIREVSTGMPLAHIFYIAFRAPSKRGQVRPVAFIWNGGPGLPALSLNFEGAGPKRIENGRVVDNADTWLTDMDLVFVDPVGTGFSRAVSADAMPAFTSIVGDVDANAEFVRAWVIRHRAQAAPLILAGQSYASGRAGSVAYSLLKRDMDVRGLALISSTVGLPGYADQDLVSEAFHIADYAVTALFYDKLPPEYGTTPDAARANAEQWVRDTYLPALRTRDRLTADRRRAIVAELARRIGLKADQVDPVTMTITQGFFLGHIAPSMPYYLDYRYLEPYRKPPLDAGVAYIRDALGYNSDLPYLGVEPVEWGFAPDGNYPVSVNTSWLHSTVRGATPEQIEKAKADYAAKGQIGNYSFGPRLPGAAAALERNPALKILVAHGAYDPLGGCSIDAEHARHLPPAYDGAIRFRCYLAGHAIYRDALPRAQFAEDMRRLARDAAASKRAKP